MTSLNYSREKRIEPIHLSVVGDPIFLGQDIYEIADLDLLTCWLKQCKWLNYVEKTAHKTKELREFSGAVWIQLNLLHPKTLLKFEDLNEKVHQA